MILGSSLTLPPSV
ncbi:hypothetical protein LINPERHAP2_LOCUS33007 [Linum perenne]